MGGGGFALYRNADGSVVTSLDFRERAPTGASVDMFADASSRAGGLAVAVPMESKGLLELHSRYAKLPLKVLAQPAIRLAEKGFVGLGFTNVRPRKFENTSLVYHVSPDLLKSLCNLPYNFGDLRSSGTLLGSGRTYGGSFDQEIQKHVKYILFLDFVAK